MKLIIEILILIARLIVANRHNKEQLIAAKEMLKEKKVVNIKFKPSIEKNKKFDVWIS